MGGGACPTALLIGQCSYFVEEAGDIGLDELTGIQDYDAFCKQGNMEYDKATDKGRGMSFWDGFDDAGKRMWREQMVNNAFQSKYPTIPLALGEPICPP